MERKEYDGRNETGLTARQLVLWDRDMLPEMRRSTMWFLIAGFWLADLVVVLVHHGVLQALVTAAAVLAFAGIGIRYRLAESRSKPLVPRQQ